MKLFVLGLAYLMGSIPTGFWIGKLWKGIDVRDYGSGNLGATNVFRVLGKGPGLITLIIDILKGALPVLGVERRFPEPWMALLAGLLTIIGHTSSIFVRFRGGKGVATSAGVFGALLPVASLMAFATFAFSFFFTRIVSVSSILAACVLSFAAFFTSPDPLRAYTATVVTGLLIWTHRANLKRLIRGTEPRIAWSQHR